MRLIAFVLAVITALASFGNRSDDSVTVTFRIGHRQFDPSLGNNREAMDSFVRVVQKADAENNIDSIVIRAYASPDGSNRANDILSRRRCDVIADLIANRTGVDPNFIHRMPEGIAWNELRNIVAGNPNVPSREQVLDILDNTPLVVCDDRGNVIDSRKRQLMNLNGGRPYRWLFTHVFPTLRNAVAVALIRKQEEPAPEPESEPEPEPVEIAVEPGVPDNINTAGEQPDVTESPVVIETPESQYMVKRYENIALKTNLLGYPVLLPNVEVEWKWADRWSVALEYQCAWYSKTPPHNVYRLATLIPEVRYWAVNRSKWYGMYVGVFGGVGEYDFCNGKKGHEGEGAMGGLSVGYMWPIGKHLSLDAGVGLGYMHVRDKEYVPADGHYLYQLTKNINYFGPLRLKLSLVWRIQYERKQLIK